MQRPFQGKGGAKKRLKLIWSAVTRPNLMSCAEFLARLDDYLDRALDDQELQLLDEHLAICHRCLKAYSFEQGVIEEVRLKLEKIQAPVSLSQDILEKIRQRPES